MRTSIVDIPRDVALEGNEDQFGIAPFENGLIRFIENTSTPITIALQGEWGSGKTSLMNSLKNELGDNDKDNSPFFSVWLNTWEYALMKDAETTLMEIIVKLIQETSKIAKLDETSTKKLIGKAASIGKGFLHFAAKTAGNKVIDGAGDELLKHLPTTSGESTIGEIRSELESIIAGCLKGGKKGFLFFIDDLDRIDPPVAVQLLELLKNIFTIKNAIFILAIDYDVVVKGLEHKFGKLTSQNEREFRSFFDKIIQVPFSMPVSSYVVSDFLKKSLQNIAYLSPAQIDNQKTIENFAEVSSLSVGTNPRALKRLLNSLSLIQCINYAKEDNQENLKSELELLINFSLVSIQIAYPAVYRLLNLHPNFVEWDESVALSMNLKALDENVLEKLSKSEEFDDVWEQVLFRLCESDYYLKKNALNISRLLNKLKDLIEENKQDLEAMISQIISLSSVTNLEAFDKPVVNYHNSSFLKKTRKLLVNKMKELLPDIAQSINVSGKRVQTYAFIDFLGENGKPKHSLRLSSQPYDGGIRLHFKSEKRLSPAKENSLMACIKTAGKDEAFNAIENQWHNLQQKYNQFKMSDLKKDPKAKKDFYRLDLNAYVILANPNLFHEAKKIEEISTMLADIYSVLIAVSKLGTEMTTFYNAK